MDQAELETFFRFVITVSAENNIRLLGILFDDDYPVSELAMLLDLDPTVIEFGLSQLEELGLVSVYSRGTSEYFHLESQTLREIAAAISGAHTEAIGLNQPPEAPVAPHTEPIRYDAEWERKVRQTFFVGNRLARLPDDKWSRRVVLKAVASQFADGVRYPEAMFELLLKNIYSDTATLRRELINSGLIRQDRAGYWRPPEASVAGSVN